MSAAEAFFDSSVLLYLLGSDEKKAARVEQLLLGRGSVNVQVLNEIAAVALRKRALSIAEVREFLDMLRQYCSSHPISVDTHEHGLDICERYGFSVYDSMIVAAALQAGCRTLYSEDLQHSQVIEKLLTVTNPFVAG